MKQKRITKQAIMVRIIDLYRAEHPGPFQMRSVAVWAMAKGWHPVVKEDWEFVGEKLERKEKV